MKFPQNILVIVSGKRRNHIALSRAIQFAEFYDIKLNLLSWVYDPGTELSPLLPGSQKKLIKEQKLQERLDYLNELKANIESKGIPVTTQVKWHRKIQKAVIEACEETKPDLVVKRISESASSINPFTMPMDWQLLRQCPAPILLVKDEQWKLTSPILAAVDAASEDPKEQSFNSQIVGYAKLLGRLTDAPIHAVSTHITPMVDKAISIPGFDLEDLRTQVNSLNHEKLASLVTDFNVSSENQHVVEGLAEDRIPALAEEIDSQLVVMGTIGRSGIKGAFMGNTAERVLTHLQCEVLALKPGSIN
ncbi:universal stress protein UspE [Aliikangiella coralliicola]|uniref:Universal stress protein UspE n=1 Tax=Aliikangiella coralliicola TaxID=2592383 RepID=A0A545UDG0_9GAMM|nr:universal stress protein UspE [Aliikangiella coralliicola]TQV87501.1 universal stress protein UspE [Aliikangiella coralliicola]